MLLLLLVSSSLSVIQLRFLNVLKEKRRDKIRLMRRLFKKNDFIWVYLIYTEVCVCRIVLVFDLHLNNKNSPTFLKIQFISIHFVYLDDLLLKMWNNELYAIELQKKSWRQRLREYFPHSNQIVIVVVTIAISETQFFLLYLKCCTEKALGTRSTWKFNVN